MSTKKIKTNASRLLDGRKIDYALLTYEVDESDLSGVHAAAALGLDPACVFKTLVARGDRNGVVVACIPVAAELDLKALARVNGNQERRAAAAQRAASRHRLCSRRCSPVGMKKRFPTYIDASAERLPRIAVSAGARGVQLFLCACRPRRCGGRCICSTDNGVNPLRAAGGIASCACFEAGRCGVRRKAMG